MRAFLIIFLSFIAIQLTSAQTYLNGTVRDMEDSPVAFSHVYNRTAGLGRVSDLNGKFSIVARVGDTLEISYVGYRSLIMRVDYRMLANILKVNLPEDPVMLPSVTVYADRELRIPLNEFGEPLDIAGLAAKGDNPIRAGSARPLFDAQTLTPGFTLDGPITYFSKEEREKRQALEAYIETQETITYQKFVAQDSIQNKLKRLYRLDNNAYDRLMVRLNSTFPGIQKEYKPNQIWNWLIMYFDENAASERDW